MEMQQKEPSSDHETCLKAISIAIPFCKFNLNYDDLKAIKLTCKAMKEMADGLLTSLSIDGCNTDFEIILNRPALVQNLRHLHIISESEDLTVLRRHSEEIAHIIRLAAHNLREFDAYQVPSKLVDLLDDLRWPNLERLRLTASSGNIAKLQKGLFSMEKLSTLDLEYQEDLSKRDGKVLASAPFLSDLKNLTLSLASIGVEGLPPKYLHKILTEATSLEKLGLHDCSDFDYFGSAKLENLKELEFKMGDYDPIKLNLGPLLSQPRPHLGVLTIQGGILSTVELETLLSCPKQILPNLNSLTITGLVQDEDDDDGWDDEDDNDVPDWSCLRAIDLPNLVRLHIECSFKDLVGIVQATTKLPKLRHLEIGGSNTGPTRNLALETMQYSEEFISSPLVLQLTTLRIRSYYFRLDSLAILCKYASKFTNLINLMVHSHDIEGAKMIAAAGKTGGFPKLKMINFYDIDRKYDNYCNSEIGDTFNKEIGDCLKKVWPNIIYACSFRPFNDNDYGKPGEFDNPDVEESEPSDEEPDEDEDEDEEEFMNE